MSRQPVFLRLLERLLRHPQREHVVGDITEEYHRMRQNNRMAARWWLFRQGIGAVFYRAGTSGSFGRTPQRPERSASGTSGGGFGFESLMQDIRFGLRLLWRDRLVTMTVVATLSLGIGATATMYSITRGLLRDLPFDDPNDVVSVSITQVERNAQNQDVPLIDLDEWRTRQTTMVDLAGFTRQSFHVSQRSTTPVHVKGAAVSPWSFRLLGVVPQLGTDFRDADASGALTVIIGYQLWASMFDSVTDIVGQTIRVDGDVRTIIGVMPESFGFPRIEQMWIPLARTRVSGMGGGADVMERASVFARVSRAHSIEDVRNELAILGRPSRTNPSADALTEVVEVQQYTHRIVGDDANMLLYTMLAIVSSVLLIACANVTNLLLARATVRSRELAIRTALGSSRVRLLRQLLTETLLMAMLGSAGGVICSMMAVRWFNATVGHRIEIFWVTISVDLMVLMFVVALTVVTTLAVGLMPALRGSRIEAGQVLREGRGSASSRRVGRVTRFLVVGEIAVSMVLLVASGLMVRGVLELAGRDVRLQTSDVITARVRLGEFDYPRDSSLSRFYEQMEQRWVRNYAGNLTTLSSLPGQQTGRWTFAIDGVTYSQHADLPTAPLRYISHGFFSAFQPLIIAGRVLDDRDGADGVPVALVNDRFAQLHFQGDAVGRRIRMGDLSSEEPWREIVGVIDDLGTTIEEGRSAAGLFIPIQQAPRRIVTIAAHHPGITSENALQALRTVVGEIDPGLPLYQIATLEQALSDEIAPQRTFAILFGVFGGLALLLAAIGLYGTISFAVLQRQREFGVRRALGARSGHLVTTVMGGVGLQLLVGLAIGLGLAVSVSPLLRDFTFGANPRDPVVFLVVLGTLFVTAAVSSSVPLARATRVDPMQVLREE